MTFLLSLILFAQSMSTPVQAYTTTDGTLATPNGRFAITWGHNCDAIPVEGNVEMWGIDEVPNQVVLAPLDENAQVVTMSAADDRLESLMCSVQLDPISTAPCAGAQIGVCDRAQEPTNGGSSIEQH